jgi:hypothetical protein
VWLATRRKGLTAAILAASCVGLGSSGTSRIALRVRDFTPCPDARLDPSVCTVADGAYLSYDRSFNPARAALILVDAWAIDQHTNPDLMRRVDANVRSSLSGLLEAIRADGRFLVVHYANGRAIHPTVQPRSNEVVANTGEQVLEALKARRVKTLIYAGYAGNMCVVNRPLGVLSARLVHGYRNIIVVRDASLSVEPPEWKGRGLAHQAAMLFLEVNDYAVTTTVAEVKKALR